MGAGRPLLGIMRKNVEMNHLESRVTVAELNWSVSRCFSIGALNSFKGYQLSIGYSTSGRHPRRGLRLF